DLTAPTAAGTHTGYWQVRLPSGSLLRTRYFVRVVVPAATAVPPTATPTTAPDPAVDYFRANVTIADPGDEIALQWATQHADSATIYYLLGGQLSTSWQVPATGSMTYAIRPSERNRITFALYAARAGTDQFAQATLELPLTCPVTWFFTPAPDECAQDAALQSPGAEQPFEHGVMLWVEAQNCIYVLYDGPDANGEWTVYEDTWTPDDPVEDPNIDPPAGFYEPERGFGLVWRTYPEVRQRLGWATAPEQAFSTAYQSTARYKYNESYLRALDGGVYHLLPERSGWEKIA
ncbi:MAG: hypothetical protein KC425_26700, partial [Anaerolineales bacterium]|nr:hypothetical protein [Anaerolineales bacterium]